jgi:predicted XRE-type DNA-binding protein
MKNRQLEIWLEKWGLNASEGAKVLGVQKSKVSEWLNENSERQPAAYVLLHLETFDLLTASKAKKLIEERLK